MTKKYLITGATSGIGKELALNLLCDSNAKIFVLGRNEEKLQRCFGEYRNNCSIIVCNLLDLRSIQNVFYSLNGEKLDGLIHCAGLSPLNTVVDNKIDTMMETFTVNYFSFMELCKFFHNPQFSTEGASIVAMSSIAASSIPYRQSIYSSSKAALEQSIRCIAKEFLDRKIRVNAIAAGAVETEMLQDLETKSNGLKEKLSSYYPLGTIHKKEIIEFIKFLLSGKAVHITGSIFNIDSGFLVNK